jgi:hypothetical protein
LQTVLGVHLNAGTRLPRYSRAVAKPSAKLADATKKPCTISIGDIPWRGGAAMTRIAWSAEPAPASIPCRTGPPVGMVAQAQSVASTSPASNA